MNFLSLYEKLESLVGRLPESLQSPILREIRPLKTLFLHQRAPRLLLLGDRAASRSEVLNSLFGSSVAAVSEDHLQDGAWQIFSSPRGRLRALDARRPITLSTLRRALTAEPPDVALYLHLDPAKEEESTADLEHAAEVLRAIEEKFPGRKIPVVGLAAGNVSGADPESARRHLDATLHQSGASGFTERVIGLFALQVGAAEIERLSVAIVGEVPEEAKLEMVRVAGVREVQRELAQGVVRSMTAICGAVGTQPIPLADFPVLTTLQAAMVAGVMHIAGGEFSAKQAAKWLGAVGANIGVGLVLREGARAALKFIPLWGDLVSGGVAAAGTYGIGQAAIAYFIDGATLTKAREMFRQRKKTGPPKALGS